MARGTADYEEGTQANAGYLATVSSGQTVNLITLIRGQLSGATASRSNGVASWSEIAGQPADTSTNKDLVFHSVGDRTLGTGANAGDADLWFRMANRNVAVPATYYTNRIYLYAYQDFCNATGTGHGQTGTNGYLTVDDAAAVTWFRVSNEYEFTFVFQQGGTTQWMSFGQPRTWVPGATMGGRARIADNTTITAGNFDIVLDRDILTTGSRAAIAVDAIDTTGVAASGADASFSITIPAANGGDVTGGAGAITILLDADQTTNPAEGANTIAIGCSGVTDSAIATAIIAAINNSSHSNVDPASSGRGQAGVTGITASAGSSDTQITLTMNTGGSEGNITSALADVSGVSVVDVTAFTGGLTDIQSIQDNQPIWIVNRTNAADSSLAAANMEILTVVNRAQATNTIRVSGGSGLVYQPGALVGLDPAHMALTIGSSGGGATATTAANTTWYHTNNSNAVITTGDTASYGSFVFAPGIEAGNDPHIDGLYRGYQGAISQTAMSVSAGGRPTLRGFPEFLTFFAAGLQSDGDTMQVNFTASNQWRVFSSLQHSGYYLGIGPGAP